MRLTDILKPQDIKVPLQAKTKTDAIAELVNLLADNKEVVDPKKVLESVLDREATRTTGIGNGLAIPHGTNDAKAAVRRTGISFVRYAEPVDGNGKPAEFVIGIAGTGHEHLGLLGQTAHVFLAKDQVARLRAARTEDDVRAVLDGVHA